MKRWTPATMVLAPLAVVSTAAAIHAYASDTDAKPAPRPVERVVVTEPATPAPTPQARVRRAPTRTARRAVKRYAVPTNAALAAQDCREESFEDGPEFELRFGRGAAAIRRCTRVELGKARAECRADALDDPLEHRSEYGTGPAALTRCVRDSLT
jgi:hypothetical protein